MVRTELASAPLVSYFEMGRRYNKFGILILNFELCWIRIYSNITNFRIWWEVLCNEKKIFYIHLKVGWNINICDRKILYSWIDIFLVCILLSSSNYCLYLQFHLCDSGCGSVGFKRFWWWERSCRFEQRVWKG